MIPKDAAHRGPASQTAREEWIAVNQARDRIEKELNSLMDRLRQIAVIEEFPGAVGKNSPFADPTEQVQVNEGREVSFATWSRLVERANRLVEALERLRGGGYGICEECNEPIPPARLKAMPEVITCVRCQDRLERTTPRLEPAGVLLGESEEEE